MLKHKVLVAEFLTANYDDFFQRYALLLHTKNYATLRQSLKLLSELLLGSFGFIRIQEVFFQRPQSVITKSLIFRSLSS